ncbi:L,D-transpeptidase family protein [Nakamurella sp. YIM 132087]|uniref:L,D-transpeptidase family protein n=1 Tax=Nakamurella alba TaxID=2665158 RepID=A0A7K1FQ08_9ACTN|nr:L,D-transpeptidase family protein [Nakamurella alba]
MSSGRIGRASRWLGAVAVLSLVVSACGASTEADQEVVTVTVPAQNAPATTQVGVPGLDTPTTSAPVVSSSDPSPSGEVTTPTATGSAVKWTLKPLDKAKGIGPNEPVVISVFAAKITELALTGDDGSTITGALNEDKTTWTSNERLEFGTTYTIDAIATSNLDGSAAQVSSSFATVIPAGKLGVQVNIPNGGEVGIAAPIIVTFLGQVTNKADVEAALQVTTSAGDKVEGNWAWVQDEDFQKLGSLQSQVHWRPTKSTGAYEGVPYWPAGTVVRVDLKLKGVNYGGNLWGQSDLIKNFKIRKDQQIVLADASTFHLLVMVNGQIQKNYAVSYGKDSVPGRATVTGVHVVTAKHPEYKMCNQQFDYCNSLQKWAVRINNNGEFIHQNLAAKAAFGKENVSHGCVNMNEPDAQNYYNSAMYGDPVVVSNTGGPAMGEGDALYDWIFSAEEWKSRSAM